MRLRGAALTLLTVCCAAGCSGTPAAVSVVVPSAAPAAGGCARLATALPAKLDGRSRRSTKPASSLVTAWGSPAVVLRCGVPVPVGDAGQHVTVDGVSWLTDGPAHGLVVWTTTDRTTGLELSVPDSIDDQENLLGDLAPVVTATLSRAPAPASATASPSPAGPSARSSQSPAAASASSG